MPKGIDIEEDNWDFESLVIAEEMNTSGTHGKVQEAQRICDDGGKGVSTKIVEVIELARHGIEAKRKDAALSDRQTDTETELVDTRAARRTMKGKISAAMEWVETLRRGW